MVSALRCVVVSRTPYSLYSESILHTVGFYGVIEHRDSRSTGPSALMTSLSSTYTWLGCAKEASRQVTLLYCFEIISQSVFIDGHTLFMPWLAYISGCEALTVWCNICGGREGLLIFHLSLSPCVCELRVGASLPCARSHRH